MTVSIDQVEVKSDMGFGHVSMPIDGQASIVKVADVDMEESPMTPEQIDKAKDMINSVVTMADGIVEARKQLLDEDQKNKLNAIQGVGDIVKGIVKFIPGAPNPMVEKLSQLEKKVMKIGEKMTDHFVEIKFFITEVKFFVKIAAPTSVLINCTRDCLKHPGPEATKNFRAAYLKHSPLTMAYYLMSYLDQKATNPLSMAIDAGKVKKLTQFMKWEYMFRRLLESFLFLEAFASGVIEVKTEYNLTVLQNRINEILGTIEQFKENYKIDEHYWDHFKKWLEPVVKTNTTLTNKKLALKIGEQLETYLTEDAFYVVVFSAGKWNYHYSFYTTVESSQMVYVINEGHCCAFVYRSNMGNKKSGKDFVEVKNQVSSLIHRQISLPWTLQDAIETQLVNTKKVRSDGMIFLVNKVKDPFITAANCPGYMRGPGYFEEVEIETPPALEEDLSKAYLIVALP